MTYVGKPTPVYQELMVKKKLQTIQEMERLEGKSVDMTLSRFNTTCYRVVDF